MNLRPESIEEVLRQAELHFPNGSYARLLVEKLNSLWEEKMEGALEEEYGEGYDEGRRKTLQEVEDEA